MIIIYEIIATEFGDALSESIIKQCMSTYSGFLDASNELIIDMYEAELRKIRIANAPI
jgi:hypothetical protein